MREACSDCSIRIWSAIAGIGGGRIDRLAAGDLGRQPGDLDAAAREASPRRCRIRRRSGCGRAGSARRRRGPAGPAGPGCPRRCRPRGWRRSGAASSGSPGPGRAPSGRARSKAAQMKKIDDEADDHPEQHVRRRARLDPVGQVLEMGAVHVGPPQAAFGRMICFSTSSRGPSATTLPLSSRMIRWTSCEQRRPVGDEDQGAALQLLLEALDQRRLRSARPSRSTARP